MSDEMARRAATNVAAEVTGSGDYVDGLQLASSCLADGGDIAFYIHADPFLPPRNVTTLRRGAPYRYLKMAFERYYLEKIRRDLPSLHFGW